MRIATILKASGDTWLRVSSGEAQSDPASWQERFETRQHFLIDTSVERSREFVEIPHGSSGADPDAWGALDLHVHALGELADDRVLLQCGYDPEDLAVVGGVCVPDADDDRDERAEGPLAPRSCSA